MVDPVTATVVPQVRLATTYQVWGWPVTVDGDRVLLTVGVEVTALVLPAGLAEAVTAILAGRDRRAPVLVNPEAPEERVLPDDHGMADVVGTIAVSPSGWTDLAEIRQVGQRWLRGQQHQRGA
ncbi:MAG: hypothetical protein ACT4NY_32455 [Pseudonocardiales bacterium]